MNPTTLEKMHTMHLYGMHRLFKTLTEGTQHDELTPDELVAALVDTEWDDRHNRSIERGLKNARFRYKASIEALAFDVDRNVEKTTILRLAECTFINKHENVLITGSTGIGKSYIASALGHQACALGFRVSYQNSAKLFARLKMAKVDGSYLKEIAKLQKQHVLILDDFGLQPFDVQSRAALMEIIEDRHGTSSTIITSQIPVGAWHDVIGEKTVADAILDRLIYGAHRLELRGESLRKKANTSLESTHS